RLVASRIRDAGAVRRPYWKSRRTPEREAGLDAAGVVKPDIRKAGTGIFDFRGDTLPVRGDRERSRILLELADGLADRLSCAIEPLKSARRPEIARPEDEQAVLRSRKIAPKVSAFVLNALRHRNRPALETSRTRVERLRDEHSLTHVEQVARGI